MATYGPHVAEDTDCAILCPYCMRRTFHTLNTLCFICLECCHVVTTDEDLAAWFQWVRV